MKKLLCCVLCIFVLVFISACSGGVNESSSESASAETGTIAFSVIWKDAPKTKNAKGSAMVKAVDCDAAGISTVEGNVYDENETHLKGGGPWNCDDHSGTISGVKKGENRTVVIIGNDSSGHGIYRGEVTGVTVGKTNDVVEIEAEPFTPTILAPADGESVVYGAFQFQWSTVTGATEYQIQVSTDSGFGSTMIDELVLPTSYQPTAPLPVGTCYWRVKSRDRHDKESGWSVVGSINVLQGHTVTFTSGANGSLSGDTTQIVLNGGDCTAVTANPNTGYHFTGWTGDIISADNPLTITNVTSDMNIQANFDINLYTVTFTSGANGSLSGDTTQIVSHGSSCTAVTANPDPNYHFSSWSGDITSADNPLTIINVTTDMDVQANFAIDTYTVTFTSGANGSLSGDTTQTVPHGGNCTAVTANPNTGYHFTAWSGDSTSTDNPLTITNVTTDMDVQANFSINVYTVTFTSGANGNLSGDTTQFISHGSNCTAVTARPNTGYHFTAWSGDSTSTDNPLTITNVISDMNVQANYAINTYIITASAGPGGTITPSGNVAVNHGDNRTFTITASGGYNVGDVVVDGESIGPETEYTFTDIWSNHTIEATFYAGRWYVDGDIAASGDGQSWGQAFKTIREAVEAASGTTYDEIWVKQGPYLIGPAIDVVIINKALAMYGGFEGNESQRQQRNLQNDLTEISTGRTTPIFEFEAGSNNSVLDGFTFYSSLMGGGISCYDASPLIKNCTIRNNLAEYTGGGGIYIYGNSAPTITNCEILDNESLNGGGGICINSTSSSPTIVKDCTIASNSLPLAGYGGGIYAASPAIITNCTIIDNYASNGSGAGITVSDDSVTIVNCIIADNHQAVNGGGIYCNNADPLIINCTILDNTAYGDGGGIYSYSSFPVITNSILWGNSGPQIYDYGSSSIVTYCDIEGGYAGSGNINQNPLFVDVSDPDPTTWDLRLQPGSPCIDAGNNVEVPGDTADLDNDLDTSEQVPLDGRGGARFTDDSLTPDTGAGTPPIVDMGAFEYVGPWHVKPDGSDSNIGNSWDEAFQSIQKACKSSCDGDEIWVMGTHDLTSQIDVKEAVAIYGGFDGTETERDQRDWETNVTTVDGQTLTSCIDISADATIDGFTITGGLSVNRGGGMVILSSSPMITNCIFSNNSADFGGGAIYSLYSSPVVTNCNFSYNTTKSYGGAVNTHTSSPVISDCTFYYNSADSGGGAMENMSSSPTITNCIFAGNSAGWAGGGIYLYTSSPSISNCIFSDNSAGASGGGGGIYASDSSPLVTNCTFAYNNDQGTIYNYNSSPTITNCILWGNSAEEIYDNNSSPTVTYCDIEGGYAGSGNINQNPRFVDVSDPDPVNWDVHLVPGPSGSPCIDAGNNSAIPVGISTDLDGNSRRADDPNTGDTGSGTPPIVDMGAYEYQ